MVAPIFIVGTGRSGTSLLRALLNAHPNIYITQEAGFFMWLPRLRRAKTAEAWLRGYQRTAAGALLGALPVQAPPGAPRSEAVEVVTAMMQAKAARFGRGRFGDKTPMHIARLDAIFAAYPDAKVVHVVRHPVPTVVSMMEMPWASNSALLNALLVRGAVDAVRPYTERVLELRLESLLESPREVLGRVLAFVGEPWDEAVLHHSERAPFEEDPRLPWLIDAERPLRAPGAGRAVPLGPRLTRRVEAICAPLMSRFGYAPWPEPGPERPWSVTHDLIAALQFGARTLRMTRPEQDDPDAVSPEAQLRWLFHLNPSPHIPDSARALPPLPGR
ncbi:MAG: hypothetical protein RIT28_387 [Pseudomonadota bacterium]